MREAENSLSTQTLSDDSRRRKYMRRILVLGANGMLGYAVCQYFKRKGDDVIELTRGEFDIVHDPIDKLGQFSDGVDVAINCAGVIKPMIARTPIEDVLKVNSIFPHNLAGYCKKLGIMCFHITTDCVYTGEKGAYTEEDYVDAEDVYGLSKAGGDTADCMVLRTSIVGEEKGRARSLLEWARSEAGNEVRGFTNHKWNGVTTVYLAEIIEQIIEKNLYQRGVFHIHSPEPVTKLELVGIFNNVYELGLAITPAEAAQSCDRSLSSIRDVTERICRKPLLQQVREMRAFFSERATP